MVCCVDEWFIRIQFVGYRSRSWYSNTRYNTFADFVKIYEKVIKASTLALAANSEAPAVVIQEIMKLSSSLLAFSPLESVLFPGGLLLESIFKHEVRSHVILLSVYA